MRAIQSVFDRLLERRHPARAMRWAVALVLAAALGTHVLGPFMARNIFLLFFIAVSGASLAGGFWPGLVATSLSALILGTRLIAPLSSLPPTGLEVVRALLFAAVGLLVSVLAETLRRARHDAIIQFEALLRSEAKFRGVFENAALGVGIMSLEGACLDTNATLRAWLGYDTDELRGIDFRRLLHPDDVEQDAGGLDAMARGERPTFRGERRLIGRDGRVIHARVSAHLVRDDRGAPWLIVALIEDVTERRRLEDQVREALKMEAVGRLAGGVAHDFNNVLTSVTGNLRLLIEDMDPDDPALARLTEVEREAWRAAGLTRQLLAFSRQQLLQPRVIDLNAVVRDAEPTLARLVGGEVTIELQLADDLEPVRADPGGIKQVLAELAVNARDAMPGGGTLRVVTFMCELDEETPFRDQRASPGRYVNLAVQDTGVGMDPTTRARLFEPFYTTKRAARGTGLGLSSVYGFIRQSAGYVQVTSEPGAGAEFRILLPAASTPAEAPVAPAGDGQAAADGVALVVEDEAAVRSLVRRLLERQGFTVQEAENGVEGLEVGRSLERLDLLVTDLVMPGMSGSELARRIVRERPDLPVLLMSGYAGGELELPAGVPSWASFIEKPFAPAAFADKVRDVLASARPTARR